MKRLKPHTACCLVHESSHASVKLTAQNKVELIVSGSSQRDLKLTHFES